MKFRVLAAMVPVLTLAGCASTSEYTRSQPVTHFPATASIDIPEELNGLITLHCMKGQEVASEEKGEKRKECLYVSADASKLTGTVKLTDSSVVRDKAITYLVSLSDMNCSNFMQRAFANKSGLDFTKNFISDLASGLSAGTAHASPATAAALNVGNLIVGKGVDTFNATYYYDKTFQALESAVAAERSRIRTYITAKQAQANTKESPVKYEIVQALSDIRAYDDACSIKAGLAELVQLADAKKKEDEQRRMTVELSDTPVQTARHLLGVAASREKETGQPR